MENIAHHDPGTNVVDELFLNSSNYFQLEQTEDQPENQPKKENAVKEYFYTGCYRDESSGKSLERKQNQQIATD